MTPMRVLPVVGTAALVLLTGCSSAPSDGSAERADARGSAETVVTGLDAPWSIAFAGDTPLVSTRDDGEILEIIDDGTRVAGTIDDVEPGGETGLMGLATDDRDRLYVHSTGPDGNRVERYAVEGEPGALSLGDAETIVDGLPSATIHSGGRIAFGPDGMLYVTVGDAGDSDDAQDRSNPAGSILRLTPDGDVPDDNPFDGSPVFSYGHRNPQGLAWAADGTMFASEFGADTWDELNVIEPGRNYGWPVVEGIGGDERFTDPVQQWRPDEASPSGIEIHDGTIHIANLRGEVLRTVPVADPSSSSELLAGEYGRLRDVTTTPDGDLWILTNNTDGRGSPTDGDDRILRLTGR
ncbi:MULTISPECIES: PQQ-dependent sugar dehydrogenase [Prauserella salsuginis group]|uniref:Glucose/arabinose dehydrogenase n=2 Tax=Prauserella salsuginis group TaxID=2893672 RepID=A0A839XPX2_9PSEU|nr:MULTISPECIES: PQQ-dependent sugar dehydrogenase [Prauserella salsuginis group]MBB3664747.1 glucose/arabinose dehydrogenase [Prauserella sediminis]